MKTHRYHVSLAWTGNDGAGTGRYDRYRRDHEISVEGHPPIPGSSDPAFRGNPARYSPEELLVGALSACHMLWYLHVCAVNGVVVTGYDDGAAGEMAENPDGSGQFTRVILRPVVALTAESDAVRALALHAEAHRFCFLARSMNFPVEIEPRLVAAG
jgi:organic hydroperoxide reductase OsmC/OhrA